jgi:hypothetical protein
MTKVLNFWEARQAALEGKKVKRLLAEDEFSGPYTSTDFLTRQMAPCEVSGHWEIAEEPETITSYMNVYNKGLGDSRYSIEDCDMVAFPYRLGILEVVVNLDDKTATAKFV